MHIAPTIVTIKNNILSNLLFLSDDINPVINAIPINRILNPIFIMLKLNDVFCLEKTFIVVISPNITSNTLITILE